MSKKINWGSCLSILALACGVAQAEIVWSQSEHGSNAVAKNTREAEWYKFSGNQSQDYFQPNHVTNSITKLGRLALGIRLTASSTYGGMGLNWNSDGSAQAIAKDGVCITYRSPLAFKAELKNSSDVITSYELPAVADYSVKQIPVAAGNYKLIQFLYSGAGTGASNTMDIVQIGLGTDCSSTPSASGTPADVPAVGTATSTSAAFWDLSSSTLTTVPGTTELGGSWETFTGTNATVTAKDQSTKAVGFTATLSPSSTSDYPAAGISMTWLAGKDTADISTKTGLCVTYRATKPLRVALEQAGIIYDNSGNFYNGNFFAQTLAAQTSFKAVNLPFSNFTQEASWGFKTVQDLKRQLALRFEYKSNTASTNDVEILQVGFTGQCQDVDFPLTQLRSSLDTTFSEDDTLKLALSSVFQDRDSELGYTIESNVGTSLKSATLRNDTLLLVSVLNPTGSNTLQIIATDTEDPSIFATFALTVTPTDKQHAPIAASDAYTVNEDTKLTIDGPGVLANDYDLDNETLTLAIKNAPSHASSFTLLADGGFEYTPAANYYGADEFSYTITAGGTTVSGKATITVVNVNDKPTVQGSLNNLADLVEDFTTSVLVTINKSDLGNGSSWATFADLDADNLSYAVHSNGKIRTSVVSNNVAANTYTFSLLAAKDSNGLATVTLYAKDAKDSVGIAFSVNITPVDDKPTAKFDEYATTEDVPLNIAAAKGLFANDLNPDKLALSATIVDPLAHGTLTLGTNGAFSYTPEKNWNGKDTLTYTLTAGSAVSDTAATVVFTVAATNDSPELAVNASIADTTVLEDFADTIQIATAGLFTDAEGQTITLSVASSGQVKTVLAADGTLRITSVKDSNGTALVTLSATDGVTGSTPTTLSFYVKITPVNDAPRVIGKQSTLSQYTGNWTMKVALANIFADADGETLDYSVVDLANPACSIVGDTLYIQSLASPKGAYTVFLTAKDAAKDSAKTSFDLYIMQAPETSILPSHASGASTWRFELAHSQGYATLHDLQGNALERLPLPSSPEQVLSAAQRHTGSVILRMGTRSWLLDSTQR